MNDTHEFTQEASSMITFENVTKVYPDETVAIEDITFEVERGTTTVFVGPSGCGKTTTMTLVNRLEEPTEGTVYYDGTDIQELEKVELRRDIGYVIQEIGLFDHMTVGENVATVPELRGWDEDRIDGRVDELLELMGLQPATYRDQYPSALSGGQQQRVGVARALAADPDVILMDEPFGALDPITRAELQDEFLEIQERIDTTILFVTHDINEALKMGDKIAVFDVGELVQYGTPREILENPANDFVREFIGDNRALKELQITRVEEIMRPATVDREPQAAAVDGGTSDAEAASVADVHVSPTDSAEVALSRMIETDTEALRVVEDGDVVGRVTERDIRDYRSMTEVGA
ncbi:ABC transporter related protein [Haladaptatus paucihalophilus DX253]|uniref:Molybdate/tungstate import ATP-binding protein WtpC n=2 Tax=Haladaptatus paucihalophilus TaxID=367189 RepID=E7QZL3_HALPU|nr:ABC transporter related protein [Haladaptatus paucihalophilus DX253]SHL06580.1 osmoprotectant transport system ATP-binding protein [Haladaptatus paucihalophilus DX253]